MLFLIKFSLKIYTREKFKMFLNFVANANVPQDPGSRGPILSQIWPREAIMPVSKFLK